MEDLYINPGGGCLFDSVEKSVEVTCLGGKILTEILFFFGGGGWGGGAGGGGGV